MKRLIALLTAFLFTAMPAMAAYSPNAVLFGGRGDDGDVTKSGTETAPVIINARKFTVSGTWNAKSGTVINSTSDVVITGTIDVAKGLESPAILSIISEGRRSAGIGGGVGPGEGGQHYSGGSGGGFGGVGGNGSTSYSQGRVSYGGTSYTPDAQPCGSPGGNGQYYSWFTGSPGKAGAGGGAIKFYSAGNITISGSGVVQINGGNGEPSGDSQGGAAGGGSGGFGLFTALKSITVSAVNGVRARGGSGGNGQGSTGNGGGGGGGYALFVAPSISLSGGVDVSGGAKGTGGSEYFGAANGATGVILSIQAVPTLPLIAAIDTVPEVQEFLAYLGCSDSGLRVAVNEKTLLSFIDYKNRQHSLKRIGQKLEKDAVIRPGGYCEAA